jgi:acetolactate synthase-1/2/3 large subunit
MAMIDGGHLVAKALKLEGVDAVFTLCGGHVAPIYEGCLREGIRVYDNRHEQASAHAADGYGRLTKKLGVAIVTAGPGVTDCITGVANAFHNGSPMMVIGGRSPNFLAGRGSLQEMEQLDLFRTITKWRCAIPSAAKIPELMTIAFRHAFAGKPGPVFIEIATDVLLEMPEEENVEWPSQYRHSPRAPADPEALAQAAALLERSERPAILAGSQIYWDDAGGPLRALAERLHAPVFLNGMARGALVPEHPLFFTHVRKEALSRADAVLVVGATLDFRVNYGRPPTFGEKTELVQIDRDQTELGRNRPCAVGLCADTWSACGQLVQALEAGGEARRRDWVADLRAKEAARQAKLEEACRSDARPMTHYRFARGVAQAVDDDTIIVGDGGDVVAVASKVIPRRKLGTWMDPGPLGTLGVGPSFAMAAKVVHPDKKVLIVFGDGSFGLNGFDLESCLRQKLPVVCVVGHDAAWGQIRGPQIAFYGEERAVATGLAPTRYDRVVEALGGQGEHVEDPAQIPAAIRRGFESGTVYCVNCPIDPTTLRAEAAAKGLTI